MPNHLGPGSALALLLVVLAMAEPVRAADLRYGPGGAGGPPVLGKGAILEEDGWAAWGRPPRPYGRPVNGRPGYVGSDYGLGKPAFTGLGSRPDWGRSSE